VDLLKVMQSAADRDTVAREYATGFALTFDVGIPSLKRCRAVIPDLRTAIVQTYLTILAKFPDSLIARKVGLRESVRVSREAAQVLGLGGVGTAKGRQRLAALDRKLRRRGNLLNPGTTADLVTASIFVTLLQDGISHFLATR
jgi:triphosphoribosyl-dephospho-CoA synthase